MYGTSLGSIHSERDQQEIEALWRINNNSNLWIGLEHIGDEYDEDSFLWTDYTLFDYGSNSTSSPLLVLGLGNKTCFQIESDGQWKEEQCDIQQSFICNLPSELSRVLNTWSSMYDSPELQFDDDLITITEDYDIYGPQEMGILNKEWYNANHTLCIDYQFVANLTG